MPSAGVDKLILGVERLGKAGNDQDLLGAALTSIHGALEDRFRHLLAITPEIPETDHARILDVARVQWNELIDLMRLHRNLSAEDATLIRTMNRERQEIAHGGRFRGKRTAIERYATFVAGFFPEFEQQTVVVPPQDLPPHSTQPTTPRQRTLRSRGQPSQSQTDTTRPIGKPVASASPHNASTPAPARPAQPEQPAAAKPTPLIAARTNQPAAAKPNSPTSAAGTPAAKPTPGRTSPSEAPPTSKAPSTRTSTTQNAMRPPTRKVRATPSPPVRLNPGLIMTIGLVVIIACAAMSTLTQTQLPAPNIATVVPPAPPLPTVGVAQQRTTTSELNLRTDPDVNAHILVLMPANTSVTILADGPSQDGHQWVRVRYGETEGWADAAYLR